MTETAAGARLQDGPDIGCPPRRLDNVRVLMYSHDTFGLGHLRRCRAIAHALVEQFKGVHVLILSGSPIAGAFDFRARVDFIKIPSVVKLYNGEYTSIDSHIDIQDTLKLRESIIQHTAQSFQPDIIIVDKEPLGLRGELERTLTFLKARGCLLVLGLREVLDAPDRLAAEWARRDILRKIDMLYDRIWVYGPDGFYNPLAGLDLPIGLEARLSYTGFLRRSVPAAAPHGRGIANAILVTGGGGGDGDDLARQVLAAWPMTALNSHPLVLILGPFMRTEDRDDIHRRAGSLANLTIIDFETNLETMIEDASAVVSMGGYNTFCEIVSLDKRALIVPRVEPRLEQYIRARRAAELGLVDMLTPSEAADPQTFAAALDRLPLRALPSQVPYHAALDGLEKIGAFLSEYIEQRNLPHLNVFEGGKAGPMRA